MNRSAGSEELLQKGENALKACQEKLEKATEREKKLEDRVKRSELEWSSSIEECLSECTLKARFKGGSTSHTSRQKQQGTVDVYKKALEQLDMPGKQLK